MEEVADAESPGQNRRTGVSENSSTASRKQGQKLGSVEMGLTSRQGCTWKINTVDIVNTVW